MQIYTTIAKMHSEYLVLSIWLRCTTSDLNIVPPISFICFGRFTNIASEHLNQRLFRFVESRRQTSSAELLVFNDYDLQSCETTELGDARHHRVVDLAKVRLLGNLLTCTTT